MNEFKITITIPGLPEAINNLAEAIRGDGNSNHVGTQAPAKEVATQLNTATPTVAPTATTVTPVNPTAAPATTVVPPVATAAPSAPAPTEATANYTIEQLSVAGAALCEQGKMAQLIALLGKYGVQAVTQLKPTPDVLNAFAAEMKALGTKL